MLAATHLIGFGASAAGIAFAPTDIAGLALWLRADLGITKDGSDLVATWADQSGNARDATEATNQPLWVANQANGNPIVRFDGTNDRLNTASYSLAQPLTMFVVCKILAHNDLDGIVATGSGTGFELRMQASPVVSIRDEGSSDGAAVNSAGSVFELYKFILNGTSSVLALDDGADQTSVTDFAGDWETGTFLGTWAAATAGRFGNVELAEVIQYAGAITGANLASVKAYLNARYALW